MHHYFNTEIAKEVGVNAAVILENIAHWVFRNQVSNKNHFDGHYWTYNSNAAMAELFPYMNARQVRYALDALRKAGLIITGNYNKNRYDRTLWYTVSDACAEKYFPEITHSAKTANGTGESDKPIPDINTNNKPNINFSSSPCDAPIPAESVRKEKNLKSCEKVNKTEPSPYRPTSDSEENSAAGIVSQGHLVKNLTESRNNLLSEMLGKLYDNAYRIGVSPMLELDGNGKALEIGEAFDYWLDHALYRESAREAYLNKFLEAWQRLLGFHSERFWMPSSGSEDYVWQNVIKNYADNWNPGTPSERREAKVKEILDGNSTLD